MPSLTPTTYCYFVSTEFTSNTNASHLTYIMKSILGLFAAATLSKFLLINVMFDLIQQHLYHIFIDDMLWFCAGALLILTETFFIILIIYIIFAKIIHHPKFHRKIYWSILVFVLFAYLAAVAYFGHQIYNIANAQDYALPIYSSIVGVSSLQSSYTKMTVYYMLLYLIEIPLLVIVFAVFALVGLCCIPDLIATQNVANTNNSKSTSISAPIAVRTGITSIAGITSINSPRSAKSSNNININDSLLDQSLLSSTVNIAPIVPTFATGCGDSTGINTNDDNADESISVSAAVIGNGKPVVFVINCLYHVLTLAGVVLAYMFLIKLVDCLNDTIIVNYYTQISYTFIIGNVIFKYIFRIIGRNIDRMRIKSNLLMHKSQLNDDINIIIKKGTQPILNYDMFCNVNISFELLLMIYFDASYWIRDRFLTIYFDRVTYENFFLFKTLHISLELIESFVKMTPWYFNTTNYLYQKYFQNCCIFTCWLDYDDCNQQAWLNRCCIDVSFRFVIGNVCTLYIAIRYTFAVFSDWENTQYSYQETYSSIEKHFILLSLTIVLEWMLYFCIRLWFKYVYQYDMFAIYEYVMNNVNSNGVTMFWCFAIAFQVAIWIW